jgi:Domain of unknown function (DUF5348)
MSETIYTLVPSTNRGRYTLNDPEYVHDLTTGERNSILLGGNWVEGRVEHANVLTHLHVAIAGCYALSGVETVKLAYYFLATDGTVCGLCTGMKVRLI